VREGERRGDWEERSGERKIDCVSGSSRNNIPQIEILRQREEKEVALCRKWRPKLLLPVRSRREFFFREEEVSCS
jgi:hypothetical protein